MKHIKLFENFPSIEGLNVGDVVYIKPTEAEFTVVCVDAMTAKQIEPAISMYDPNTEVPPVKLIVTDPSKNYVVHDNATSRGYFVTKEQALQLVDNPDYIVANLMGNELEFIDSGVDNSEVEIPKYVIPVVKNKIIYVDGWGTIMFLDEDILSYYSVIDPKESYVKMKIHKF